MYVQIQQTLRGGLNARQTNEKTRMAANRCRFALGDGNRRKNASAIVEKCFNLSWKLA